MSDLATQFTMWQWLLGAAAALLVGISKTGVPGVGILVVTMLAQAFGGWTSIAVMLPMLAGILAAFLSSTRITPYIWAAAASRSKARR